MKVEKLINVIESCHTLDQLKVAMVYAERFPVDHQDIEAVMMTLKRKIQEL